ncbi:MAG TPA: glycoside hydrolase family 38 C-terminal domain-containing protein [bacterium]|nr:glycoside hydrolase family 38 C-terminal domain-containing protein [bacterium]
MRKLYNITYLKIFVRVIYMERGLKTILSMILVAVLAAGVFAAPASAGERAGKQKKKAFIISHFHCDPVWTNTQAGEIMRSLDVVNQQLEYASEEPKFRFILSEIDYLKPYWDAYPWRRQAIMELAEKGRIEFTGGYCEPDEAEVSGEGIIRNFIYGKIYKESVFDTIVDTAAQHDVFGHTVQLPQILLGTGHKYSQYARGNLTDMPSEYNQLAPDGSSIITKRIDYGGNAGDAFYFVKDRNYYDLTNNAVFMSGGDFREPDRQIGGLLKNTKSYLIYSGTHKIFFQSLLKDAREQGVVIPEISRDHTPLLVGCYTSRIETKWANRMLENLLIDSEKFNTLYSLQTGKEYPWLELDRAWRMLLYAQHHDALPGTSTDNVNLDLLSGWHEAMAAAWKARDRALNGLATFVDTAGAAPAGVIKPLVVFNSLNWERGDLVEAEIDFDSPVPAFRIVDSTGVDVPFELIEPVSAGPIGRAHVIVASPDVPSFGYTVFYITAADSFAAGVVPVRENISQMENNLYSIKVDPKRGGGISSIYSKKLKREFIDSSVGLGNTVYAAKENKDKVECPWSIHTTGQYWGTADYPADEVWVERSAVRSRLIVKTSPRVAKVNIMDQFDDLKEVVDQEVLPEMVREVVIYNDTPRIDFFTHMNDYKANDILFKVGFPADLPGTVPMFEERFATIGRERNTENFLFYDFWREPGVKRGREYPAYNWMDLSPTTSINFTDGSGAVTAQYPLAIGELVVTDSNAVKTAANALAVALVKKGVTTTPTDHEKKRTNEYYGFRVSLGTGDNEYSASLLEKLGAARRGEFDKCVADSGYCMLFAADDESVTDPPQSRPIPILIARAASDADLDRMVADIAVSLEKNNSISLPASSNLAKAEGMMSGHGLALINYGNPGNSVEANNTMMLTLMKSPTGWPSGRGWEDNWAAQRWNHRFRYALVPHEGDWLEARVVRTGYEFNNPMHAIPTGLHSGSMKPGGHSFMEVKDADVVVTSFKPAGYPVIDGAAEVKTPGAVSIRMYNPEYMPTSGTVSMGFDFSGVKIADMLDRPVSDCGGAGGAFDVELSPFKIGTYILDTPDSIEFAPTVPEYDGVPQYIRYWETNENVPPEGYMPVSVILQSNGYADGGSTLKLRVTVSSNVRDRGFEGDVKFSLPDGASLAGDTKFKTGPMGVGSFDVEVKGLDQSKLTRQYISAVVEFAGREYEDVLHFSNWKVHRGDVGNGGDAELDDSGWETAALSKFWSRGHGEPGVTWYRKNMVVPEGMGDIQFTFEKPYNSGIEVYIDGELVRKEGPGIQHTPLVNRTRNRRKGQMIDETQIAIRLEEKEAGDPAWCSAFMGSEALFNGDVVGAYDKNLTVRRGGKGRFSVEFVNPFDQPLQGRAILASPVETWPEGGAYRLMDITPAAVLFEAGAGGTAKIGFDVGVPDDAMPGTHVAAVKFVYKGKVAYTGPVKITIE